ncbi:MAG: DUF721 domain-containing protein [Paludibacteraceae bacterium]|nr:DUF721 domain-containing protein [Paludibacteraceae bacterium]MBR5971045.1 DUF721 domain-containing protein [Paludibacteraceae bacterium]
MKRQNSQSIGNVLQELLQDDLFCKKLNETKLIESWRKMVGENVQSKMTSIYIKNEILYVTITSPALKSDLRMKTAEYVRELNQEIGCEVIRDIKFL